MKFVKPERGIIERSKHKSECECWKPYTAPIVGVIYWKRLEQVFDYLKNKRYNLILEIGCGYGFFLPSLCQISDRVIASDIQGMFDFYDEVTLRRLQKNYSNLELRIADATNLSDYVNEGSCDVVVAISVLEHINDYERAVDEIQKCLKPNGIFACVLPTENWFYRTGRRLVGYSGKYHEHFSYEEVRDCLQRRLKKIRSWNCPFGLPLFDIGIYTKK